MTYKEAYMNCKTLKELEDMVDRDVKVVMIFGMSKDRLGVIRRTAEEVANLKFKEVVQS